MDAPPGGDGDDRRDRAGDRGRTFASTRGPDGGEPVARNDMWVAHRTADGWSDPEHLGDRLSTDDIDSHPVETEEGLWFHSRRPGGTGG